MDSSEDVVMTDTQEADDGSSTDTSDDKHLDVSVAECSICLLAFCHAVELDCGHRFCFLCIKGVAQHNLSCPLCRQNIEPAFFNSPRLVHMEGGAATKPDSASPASTADLSRAAADDSTASWLYQGRNGWWRYDERTTAELETQYLADQTATVDMLIGGFMYSINFQDMLQVRKEDQRKRRKIMREITANAPASANVIGVAGLRGL